MAGGCPCDAGERGQRQQICLFAYSLTIEHPISKEEMTFKVLPKPEKTWNLLDDVKEI